jgi:O-antigen ligase
MRYIQKLTLLIFFFSINFEMWDPWATDHFSISKFTGLVYVLAMLPSIIHFRTSEEYKPVLGPIWCYFIFLTLISFFHVQPGFTNYIDLTIFQNIILFWILLNHESQEKLILEKGMLCFALGAIVLAVLFNLGIGLDVDPLSYRTSIFGDNANNVGVRMSIALAIISLTIIQNRLKLSKYRYLMLLGLPFIFSTMLSTGSRVAFISFVLAFILFIFLFKSDKKWEKPLLLGGGILILFVIWSIYLGSEVISDRLIHTIREGDLSDRDIIWKKIIPVWWENPVFGVGKTGYESIVWKMSGRYISPHNVFLEILCLTGITGFAIYSLVLYRIVSTGYKIFRYSGYLLPVLLLIPVAGLLLSAQLLPVKIGWCIFAYVTAHKIYFPKV